MALNLIDKLHLQARKTTSEDVGKICAGLLNASAGADRSSEMASLRQLFFILQAKDGDVSIPEKATISMLNAITSPEKSKRKECLLCERIIQELLPLGKAVDGDTDRLKDKIPSPLHLQMFQRKDCIAKLFSKAVKWLQAQDLEYEIERRVFTFLVGVSILHSHLLSIERVKTVNEQLGSWLQDASLYQAENPYSSNPFRKDQNNLVTEVDGTASTNFFTVLSIGQYYTDDQRMNIYTFSMLYQWIHHSYGRLMSNDTMSEGEADDDISIDEELQLYRSQAQAIAGSRSGWLSRSVSLGTSASPTSPVERQKTPVLRKAASQSYGSRRSLTPSGHSLRSSAISTADTLSDSVKEESFTGSFSSSSSVGERQVTPPRERPKSRETTPVKDDRPLTPADILRPPSAVDSLGSNNELRGMVKGAFDQLIGRTIDYCFRVLDQCDRKPKVPSDVELQNACQLETVRLLDLVCKIDSAQIPKTFRELKRLVTDGGQGDNAAKLLIVVLQFLLNHSKAVAYDPQQELKTLFHKVLQKTFNNNIVSFDIVLFILDNLEKLTLDTDMMATYFPNILKIVAWNPHTYVLDFTEIVPAMMSSATSLEVLHSLIDLPCMTVALEVMEKTKNLDFTAIPAVTDSEPVRALDAFKNAMFRPMFNFFTRAEGGHGDTIDRLAQFHSSVQDMMECPRALVCYQATPVLLRTWFNVILEEADEEFVAELLTVLIERSGVIYGIPEYKHDVERIISDYTVFLLKKFPQTIVQKKDELTEFLSVTRNISGRERFCCQLVWGVGEYMSTAYSDLCTAETVRHMYETLEVLTYEIIGVTGTVPPSQAPFTINIVSVLMSTLAKLASRCQDLITRAILCLTKVARQHKTDILEKEDQDILLNKAKELINLLKLPNFASVILNPSPTLETDRVHLDQSSMATLLRTTHRLVAPTV